MISDIKVVFTKHGNILGEIVPTQATDGSIRVKNPIMMVPNGMVDMLDFVDEDSVVIPADEILYGIKTPVKEVINVYNKTFGSGIQLLS